MAANGNKKHGTIKKSASQIRYTAERRWEANKRRRVERESARQSLCKAVRSIAANADELGIRDISRRVRAARRAA
ncbi:MAG TPA: hypothetical protein VEY92_08505 [Pseudoxanthomonas sp.]|nr:hypothetical protein [Pseudoxanthomonas sp.]